jgi:RNase P subunit RPR2
MAKPAKKQPDQAEKLASFLTPEQLKKISAWLAEKVPNLVCPICHHRDWLPPTHRVRIQASDQLGGGFGYPQIVETCAYCGHTVFFNAIVIGIEPSLDEQEGEDNG